ncbi:dep domain-containing protein 1a [Plakobranchus ocellatus]|uniref:Dep domain-containing protein 1a n=1 Tax=Plakobranchus ocellatus TaxID=259542 RepID=A0AAV3ZL20_9GAST|nr:dep domain-containing protein 1a [Plakobranchus ocellatus]
MGDSKEDAYVGPYKATKVWNDVISAFRQYLPCGRHRRYMKTFDNCFSGSAAIEWLLQYLKTNDSFQSDISRSKAASLVNKLYHAGIFEEVQVTKSMRHKTEVQENRLYRFLPESPSKIKLPRLPLAPRNDVGNFQMTSSTKIKGLTENVPKKLEKSGSFKDVTKKEEVDKRPPSKLSRKISILKKEKDKKDAGEEIVNNEKMSYPPCHIITRILTTKEIKDTWKAVFTIRLKKTLGVAQLGDIVQADLIDGYNVMHNCIYLNKSGVVTNIDASEQLPHWVISAMKCLAHWPEPQEPGLPNYAGFEKDVFGVVKDYFMGLEEPLVPYHLYDTFTAVFVMCGHKQPQSTSPYRERDSDEFTVPSSLWTSASLENIILNLTKKYCTLDTISSHYGTHEDLTSAGMEQKEQMKNFTSQEDLRFAAHLDNHLSDYNRSAFPSTDGMDKVLRCSRSTDRLFQPYSLSRFASQESCPSLPGFEGDRDFLSKSTQSAWNNRHPRSRRSFSRMYRSTPNLKVSKYETAFGPDNKTVTRVFYQNGFTADVSHDDDDDEVFPPSLPVSNHHADYRGSSNYVNVNYGHFKADNSRVKKHMPRSNSVVGVPNEQRITFELKPRTQYPSLDRNRNSCPDSSACIMPSTPAKMNVSVGKTITMPLEEEEVWDRDKLLHHDLSQTSSGYFNNENNTSSESSLKPNTLNPKLEIPHYVNVKSHPSPAVKSVVPLPALFYPTEERLTPTRQPSQAHLLTGMYGPGYRPPNRTQARRSKPPPLALTNPNSSLRSISNSSAGYDDRPPTSMHFSHDLHYRPVLDASKESKFFRNASSSSLEKIHSPHFSEYQKVKSPINSIEGDRLTSTPVYGLTNNTNIPYLGVGTCPPSGIPPCLSTQRKSLDSSRSERFINYPQTRLSEERARNALQLVALLLPPANRRKLHLLFKLMIKMTSNPNLCLDSTQTTRSLVLSTFYKAIFRSISDEDEMVVLQLVSFMLDFYAEIFSPPENIKSQVSDRLKVLQNPQVVYSPRPDRAVRFCQQVSTSEFENQRHSTTQMSALEELLENIVRDENMSSKEKRRRLKQFQRTYPAIYTGRFPNPGSDAAVLSQPKPKIKQPFAIKPLQKFKGLRL